MNIVLDTLSFGELGWRTGMLGCKGVFNIQQMSHKRLFINKTLSWDIGMHLVNKVDNDACCPGTYLLAGHE